MAYRMLLPIVGVLFATTAFSGQTDRVPGALADKMVEKPLQDEPGTLYASTIFWSKENHAVYLRGPNIRVVHGDNDFKVTGQASYLGKVYLLVFNGAPATPDTSISIKGRKCAVVKLTSTEARKKYGPRGKNGAVEINVAE